MKTVCLTLLVLGVAFAFANESDEWGLGGGPVKTNCTCGFTNKEGGRIVGGRATKVNEYPMIAALVNRGRPKFVFCGGTIITNRHVITAAHCKPRNPSQKVDVVLAEHDVSTNTESSSIIVEVSQFINHERYNVNGEIENDIALLVLAWRIPFRKNIGPACFPAANLDVTGKQVRVIGWGLLSSKGSAPNVLQKVDLDVKPIGDCNKTYGDITENQLCTYSRGKDSCQGDSGGPVLYRDPSTNRYTLVGVVSFGDGCAKPDTPGVNTRVAAYRNWILQKIEITARFTRTCQNRA